MQGFGNWLRGLGQKLAAWLRHFMAGRYGTDKLNTAILLTGVAVALVNMFIPWAVAKLVLTGVSYGLMIWAICRTLSRNTYQRYLENCKFMRLLERIKDREHKYFECPKCRQPVRVPRGKGKIAITCPKCKEKFIRKS